MERSGTLSLTLRRMVETMLSVHFDARVRIAGVQDFPYSTVSRCTLDAGGSSVPQTVVVRLLRKDTARSQPTRLHNEQAALEFLSSIGSTLAPRFIVGDASAGILITEDLGPHPSLLDLLLGNDRAAACEGLLAFARSLGTLHAQTAGCASTYDDRRARLGRADPNAEHPSVYPSVAETWRQVRDAAVQLGLPHPRGVDDDVQEIAYMLAESDAYVALSSGDPSPVNCIVGNRIVRFFDFEDAGFRHALIDAAVLRYLYPTGGPVWHLPPGVAGAVETTYRDEMLRACPVALPNAETYERGMAAACAAWTILRMARLVKVDAGPDRDSWLLLPAGWSAPIPTRSRRRQLVAIMETCIASADRAGTLKALAAWCELMVDALCSRWPEATEEVPLYPAFK